MRRSKGKFARGGLAVGDTVRIERVGDPAFRQAEGLTGRIEFISSGGLIHGTWGRIAADPSQDTVTVIRRAADENREAESAKARALHRRLERIMTELTGEKLPVNTREPRFTTRRAMIASAMHEAGVRDSLTALLIGRDRTTVIYLRRRLDDMLSVPNAYRREVSEWTLFKSKLAGIES